MTRIELNRLKFNLMADDTEENRAKYEAALAEFNGTSEDGPAKEEKEKKTGEEKAKKKPN